MGSTYRRNIHDCTSEEHVIDTFNPSTRRVQFFDRRINITIKGAEETTIVFEVAIDGTREAVGVDAIAIRLVVLFVARIIDQESIGSGRTTNDYAIQGVSLMFRAFEISVFLMVE